MTLNGRNRFKKNKKHRSLQEQIALSFYFVVVFVVSCSLAFFFSFLFFLEKLINPAGIYACMETSLCTTTPVFQKIRCALRFMRLAKRRSSLCQGACGCLDIQRNFLSARSFWILSRPVLYILTNLIRMTASGHLFYVFPK